jgi:sugar-specific transcriptional regulator TrmB
MKTSTPSDLLIDFGLTRQGAAVYLALLTEGGLSGYQVAKILGISRSNAYTALANLVDLGAAWLIEGNATRYTAVPASEFCDNRLRALAKGRDRLLAVLPGQKAKTGGYITIRGERQIMDRLHHLLTGVRERVYLALHGEVLARVLPELEALAERACKIVIITDPGTRRSMETEARLSGARIRAGSVVADQVRVIVDSHYVMTGELSGGAGATCLYSDQKHLVDLFKNAMRNELRLIELGEDSGGAT